MKDIYGKSYTELIGMVKAKQVSAVELSAYFNERIKDHDKKLRSFLTLSDVKEDIDIENTILAGVPVAVKDIFCTKGIRTTAASKVLDAFVPEFESTVTDRMKKAGGTIIGKTNMDAWAHGASSETSAYGLTYNPWDLGRYPGGSSSGSAAAVSAYLAPISLGTDTGGSIRHPASWCGILGLKPTYGRVSRYGIAAMGSSLDSPGPMGLYVEDLALMMEVIAGKDPYDATSVEVDVPEYTKVIKEERKFTLGVAKEFIDDSDTEVQEKIREAIETLEKMGHKVVEVSLLDPKYSISVYTIVQRAEVSSNLARYHGIRYSDTRDKFGKEAKRRSMLGGYVLAHGYYDQYYKKAQKVRALIANSFEETFEKVDLILAPSAPVTALKVGEFEKYPFFGEMMDRLNEPASVAGLPAISVPAGLDREGLPVGLQIIGPKFNEAEILNLSYQIQKENGFWGVIEKGLERWK